MPIAPGHPCRNRRCAAIVSSQDGFCDTCRRGYNTRRDQVRPTSTERGYNSKRWRTLAKRVRAEEPCCVHCQAQGYVRASTDVDHKIPHHGPDDPLFWDRSNLQGLCHECHSRKTATEDSAFAHRGPDA